MAKYNENIIRRFDASEFIAPILLGLEEKGNTSINYSKLNRIANSVITKHPNFRITLDIYSVSAFCRYCHIEFSNNTIQIRKFSTHTRTILQECKPIEDVFEAFIK